VRAENHEGSGKEYAGATIKTGSGQEWQSVSLVAFSSGVIEQLERLKEGDPVAVKGEKLKVAAYLDKAGEPKPSIDMVADGLLALDKPSGCKKANAGSEARINLGG
jgi:hypothetical protein